MHPQSTTSRQQFVRLCDCGCGQPTLLAHTTHRRKGVVRGQPLRFLLGHNARGRNHHRFCERRLEPSGYVTIYRPDHPAATKKGRVSEHRLVMERLIGRALRPEEVVHHRDGNKRNNAPENLHLCSSQREHVLLHGCMHDQRPAGWSRNHAACVACGTTERKHMGFGLCFRCYHARWRAARRASA